MRASVSATKSKGSISVELLKFSFGNKIRRKNEVSRHIDFHCRPTRGFPAKISACNQLIELLQNFAARTMRIFCPRLPALTLTSVGSKPIHFTGSGFQAKLELSAQTRITVAFRSE